MTTEITKDEMRIAFDLLALKLTHDNADQKLLSLAAMLRLMSRYLRQEIVGIDTSAILLTLEELTNISQNGSPKFICPTAKKPGRPKLSTENFQLASIAAAVEILIGDKTKVKDAIEFVAKELNLSQSRVEQIRKEFKEEKRQSEATKFMWDQILKAKETSRSVRETVQDLLTMAQIKGG